MTIPVSVRGMHDVALVHLPDASASGERRDDVGVGEDRRCIVDRRLIELDLGFELSDQRPLGIELLLVDGVGLRQAGVTFEVEPRIGELRFVLRLLGDRLIVLRLEERLTDIPRGPRRLKATEHFAFAPMYSCFHAAVRSRASRAAEDRGEVAPAF